MLNREILETIKGNQVIDYIISLKNNLKIKKRIDDIREELKNPKYNISKSESKDIKRNLYNIEKQRKISLKKTSKYLDELDKRILRLDKYHDYDDFKYKGIKDVENLFKISIDKDYYKPKLNKSGYNKIYAQYESKGDKILSLKEYFNLIETYLRELIEEYKLKGEWKVQLTREVNFISLKPGSDETCIMYTRSDDIEIMFGDDNEDIIEQLFESLLKKYEENLENKMRGSEFEFDGVNFLYYDLNKTSINRGGSYKDSPKLSDCNGIRTHNHLVRKRTLNHLAKLARCSHLIFRYGACFEQGVP